MQNIASSWNFQSLDIGPVNLEQGLPDPITYRNDWCYVVTENILYKRINGSWLALIAPNKNMNDLLGN